jgi:hypothetical protein
MSSRRLWLRETLATLQANSFGLNLNFNRVGVFNSCVHDTVTDMDYSHLNGKTVFYAAPANTHEHGRPTFHQAEKYGRLMVSGNVVALEPVDDDSGWWIEISPKVIAKLRQNKEARPLTYLGRTVTPDFDFGIGR